MADNKVYEDIIKLRNDMQKYQEFTSHQGDLLFKKIDVGGELEHEPKRHSKYDVQFFEWCNRRDMAFSFGEMLDDIISRFPEAARVIYDD
jgi:hypothetical protein